MTEDTLSKSWRPNGEAVSSLHHSGKSSPPYLLRSLLINRVEATPPGGRIGFCTYYFCDELLVESLLRAHERGVELRVLVEDCPRTPEVNGPAIRQLSSNLGPDQFRCLRACSLLPCMPGSFRARANLHAKIYCFSHPYPHVLLGSYNPSCDVVESPALVERIGDQDRGYNLLAELRQPEIVQGLNAHLEHLHRNGARRFFRFWPQSNRVIGSGDTQVFLYPRRRTPLLQKRICQLGEGDQVSIAASHMKAKSIVKAIGQVSLAGARVEIVCHDSERRVPQKVIGWLNASGVRVERYSDTREAPMHYKFILIDSKAGREVWFGSFNLNKQSLYFNHEVLVRSACPNLVQAFERCWKELVEEVRGQ